MKKRNFVFFLILLLYGQQAQCFSFADYFGFSLFKRATCVIFGFCSSFIGDRLPIMTKPRVNELVTQRMNEFRDKTIIPLNNALTNGFEQLKNDSFSVLNESESLKKETEQLKQKVVFLKKNNDFTQENISTLQERLSGFKKTAKSNHRRTERITTRLTGIEQEVTKTTEEFNKCNTFMKEFIQESTEWTNKINQLDNKNKNTLLGNIRSPFLQESSNKKVNSFENVD